MVTGVDRFRMIRTVRRDITLGLRFPVYAPILCHAFPSIYAYIRGVVLLCMNMYTVKFCIRFFTYRCNISRCNLTGRLTMVKRGVLVTMVSIATGKELTAARAHHNDLAATRRLISMYLQRCVLTDTSLRITSWKL